LTLIMLSGVISYLGVLWWIEKENLLRFARMIKVSS